MKNFARRICVLIMTFILCGSICVAQASEPISNPKAEYGFELPIAGTTGYGVIDLSMRAGDSTSASKITTVKAGQPFTIRQEGDSYFNVRLESGEEGWVYKAYTMVNLPDLIPSIVYNDTNATASLFRSQGLELEGITGQALYTGKTYNERLGQEQFNMPVLYTMAKKIAAAQATALNNGETLVFFEGYRPQSAQNAVCSAMRKLMKENSTVRSAINGWGLTWFISTGVSNHQKGYAMDVSLARIDLYKQINVDGALITVPTSYTTLNMPTQMHELSQRAATFRYGVNSGSKSAWKSAPRAVGMTEGALKLQRYCTDAGMTPLSSEWWHFNDLDAKNATGGSGQGGFVIEKNLSVRPSEV